MKIGKISKMKLGIIFFLASVAVMSTDFKISGLILGLHPANERRRYFVTASLIGWAQAFAPSQ